MRSAGWSLRLRGGYRRLLRFLHLYAGDEITGAGLEIPNRYVEDHVPSHGDDVHIAADDGVFAGYLHPEVGGIVGEILLHDRSGTAEKFPFRLPST